MIPFFAADVPAPLQSYITIDLKDRATDYKEAFEALKKEKTAAKVFFLLSSGVAISNIIEMSLTGNGHFILFKYNTHQGIKTEVVPVEKIVQLSYTQ